MIRNGPKDYHYCRWFEIDFHLLLSAYSLLFKSLSYITVKDWCCLKSLPVKAVLKCLLVSAAIDQWLGWVQKASLILTRVMHANDDGGRYLFAFCSKTLQTFRSFLA